MKTTTQEVFIADDDTRFTDRSEALRYEAKLENEVAIDQFLESLGDDKTEQAKSRMRNDIVRFLGFQAEQTVAEGAAVGAAEGARGESSVEDVSDEGGMESTETAYETDAAAA